MNEKQVIPDINTFYVDDVAKSYESNRVNDRFWKWEHETLSKILQDGKKINTIVDCPVGTGRFFSIYKTLNAKITGVDISPDMLKESKNKMELLGISDQVKLLSSDLLDYKKEEYGEADLFISFRLFHLITPTKIEAMVNKIASVSKDFVILQIFNAKDFSIPNFVDKLKSGLNKDDLDFLLKLKYVYRSIRTIFSFLLKRTGISISKGTPKNSSNYFFDITFSHNLTEIKKFFLNNGFEMIDKFDLLDSEHFKTEAISTYTSILILKKIKK
ncbi:class I SAM-dependent methyltransferase [Leptospira ognonensis]|uniref:Class I SAM-dependent methyltransferase n=1 Tax=Leptospira ognonensis TaxID=2484945 RepID=A0A4R9K214_9LEPT|nr:class I SAM-dependent methyltransferase [Leptospira ognonensis]TGL59769.1 class I SAM-dependent methyltransferase [Leptospira ognonensis]